jgi:two-component system, chemotaxis family, response regulator WspF
MKIAIVNDVLMAVEALKRVLVSVPEYQLIWVAKDGAEAVKKSAENLPDLILMDLLMPVMDGITATRLIMRKSPCAILIVTSDVKANCTQVFEALGAGALDAVSTPILGRRSRPEMTQILLTKIANIAKLIDSSKSPKSVLKKGQQRPVNGVKSQLPPLIVIGSSTGGPKALATILSSLPADFPAAIAIVQHIDEKFSAGLASWLNPQTPLTVEIATNHSILEAGKVLIAGSNDHLYLRSNLKLDYTKYPLEYPYRPSVDVFFKSVANHWKTPGIAVLLTGMGRDGAQGLKVLKLKGWHTITQNQATCVVYGMPKAAVEMEAAIEVLSLSEIAKFLKNFSSSHLNNLK